MTYLEAVNAALAKQGAAPVTPSEKRGVFAAGIACGVGAYDIACQIIADREDAEAARRIENYAE